MAVVEAVYCSSQEADMLEALAVDVEAVVEDAADDNCFGFEKDAREMPSCN